MTTRLRRLGLVAVWLACALLAAPAVAAETVTFHYIFRADDPFYAPRRAYTGLALVRHHRPVEALGQAVKESRVHGRRLGITFAIEERELAAGEDAAGAIAALRGREPMTFAILDLDAREMAATAKALAGAGDVMLFNARNPDDALRGADCSPVLFHTVPSRSMLTDAMAQLLAVRDWKRVLLLVGDRDDDAGLADSFERSARKTGLAIVDRRRFVLGNDPREREQNNIALLTANASYDVVFLADNDGEFGRYTPYSTLLPRPVVGGEGLLPAAWHWTFERFGAPQLNQRFDRAAGRHMAGEDWAAWAAVKTVVEAIIRTGSTKPGDIAAYVLSEGFGLDLYKGVPGSYRPWDRQLRQPILLHTHNAVIDVAPFPGFLHKRNKLDSLGLDEPETECRFGR